MCLAIVNGSRCIRQNRGLKYRFIIVTQWTHKDNGRPELNRAQGEEAERKRFNKHFTDCFVVELDFHFLKTFSPSLAVNDMAAMKPFSLNFTLKATLEN